MFPGKLAKYPGRSPAKMQKMYFISKVLKENPKPFEIHVRNSRLDVFLVFSEENCQVTWVPPLKTKLKKQFHKQNPEKGFETL